MNTFVAIFMLAGMALAAVGLVLLVVRLLFKKGLTAKKSLGVIVLGLVLFIGSGILHDSLQGKGTAPQKGIEENKMVLIVFGSTAFALIVSIAAYRKLKAERRHSAAWQAQSADLQAQTKDLQTQNKDLQAQVEALQRDVNLLSPYRKIVDAEAHAQQILQDANKQRQEAKEQARTIVLDAQAHAQSIAESATQKHDAILEEAHENAEKIAADATRIAQSADLNKKAAEAMKRIIDGYGNEFVLPSTTLLDDLAEEFGYDEVGAAFKAIGGRIKNIIKIGKGATCEYAEPNRRSTAINFVLDAFNGKRDAIMSRVRKDNYGILKQKLLDAFEIVNYNGQAFRNARITDEYISLSLDQLKLGCTLQALKEKQQEEQREIRERMREEEKARREIERALKDAAKEKEMLDKARALLEEKYAAANEEQKAMYEAQLADMQQKIKEAEERNQRALSMAQQTKAGHVYVISNMGSFGENVYKIGMTRRLEPMDRIHELGSASVPFNFDVHAMIWSEDAPRLEADLHHRFALQQMNKINHRKEFFQTTLAEIRAEVERIGMRAQWTMKAEAQEYYETLAINKSLDENSNVRDAWLKKEYDQIQLMENEDEVVDAVS